MSVSLHYAVFPAPRSSGGQECLDARPDPRHVVRVQPLDAADGPEKRELALGVPARVLHDGVAHVGQRHAARLHLEELPVADPAHPGVQYLQSVPDTYVGGEITLVEKVIDDERFTNYQLEPKETRVLFKARGWKKIVAFQTRNPIHRAHEYLQKCALEAVDGWSSLRTMPNIITQSFMLIGVPNKSQNL